MKDLKSEYKNMIETDVPDLWGRIESSLPERKESKPSGISRRRIYFMSGIAAACVCVAIIIPLITMSGRAGRDSSASASIAAKSMSAEEKKAAPAAASEYYEATAAAAAEDYEAEEAPAAASELYDAVTETAGADYEEAAETQQDAAAMAADEQLPSTLKSVGMENIAFSEAAEYAADENAEPAAEESAEAESMTAEAAVGRTSDITSEPETIEAEAEETFSSEEIEMAETAAERMIEAVSRIFGPLKKL